MITENIIIETLIREYNDYIPKQEDGLVIYRIYKQIKENDIDKTFSENKINDTIYKVLNELGRNPKKNVFLRDNETLQRLKKNLIEKDAKKKGYLLTEYAQHLCRLVENEIDIRFKPSDIEKILRNLIDILDNNLSNLEDFKIWYERFFLHQKEEILLQIRALQKQVHTSTDNLNDIIRNEQTNYEQLLKDCDNQLDEIKEQADKLAKALSLKDQITDKLKNSELKQYKEFRDIRNIIVGFITDLDTKLLAISNSFDKLKPRINKLFTDHDKREYDKKIEKFLLFLFKNSTTTFKKNKWKKNQSGNEWNLDFEFPSMVSEKVIIDLQPKLYAIAPKINFLEPPAITPNQPQFNADDRHRQIENYKKQIIRKNRVIEWLNTIENDLHEKKIIEFSDYFYSILEQDDNDFEIAVKVANNLIKKYNNNKDYEIKTTNQFSIISKYQNFATWQMKIKYKK